MIYYPFSVDVPSYPDTQAGAVPYESPALSRKNVVDLTSFDVNMDLPDLLDSSRGPNAPTEIPSIENVDVYQEQTPTQEQIASGPSSHHESTIINESEADQIAKQRVRLMAAKYSGGEEVAEIVARLEILNGRLLQKSPRVTNDQVMALEHANEQIGRIQADRQARSKRLGLSD